MPEWLLIALELLFLAAFIGGIALIYIPAALIVGGVIGVFALEYLDGRLKTEKAKS